MKKIFFALGLSLMLVGTGCASKNSAPASSTTPSAAAETSTADETQVVKIPAGWMTFMHPTLGFSIAYPGKNKTDLLKTAAMLPDLTGNKQPNVIIHVGEKGAPLDTDGCLISELSQPSEKTKLTIHGVSFCKAVVEEGAAGSIYRTQNYTTVLSGEIVTIVFVLDYPTSVREYAGCEDAAESKPKCKELAFDKERDTAIFSEIMGTFQNKK